MKLKISLFDDVPEVIENVSNWRVSERETLSVTTTGGDTIAFNSAAWLRLEEIR